jgi:hypothetical protein
MADAPERHLTWATFHRDILVPGVPAVHPVPGTPYVELFFEPDQTRVGIRARCSDSARAASELEHLRTRLVEREGGRLLEISTDRPSLFRSLYALLVSTADLIQLEGVAPSDALQQTIDEFLELVAANPKGSPEKLRGLIGELWVLERMLCSRGAAAVSAWVGPFGETHDFRVGNVEIEVKTTTRARRIHMISSIDQLEPSQGARLYLLSLQFVRSGQGGDLSVLSQLQRIDHQLAVHPQSLEYFKRALRALELSAFDSALLEETYKAKSEARLSLVAQEFPRITTSVLSTAFGAAARNRLLDASYTVDVTDLGWPEDSLEFRDLIG